MNNNGTILVIPDPHDEPTVSQERFEWLGNLIVAKQPDVIVCLGDLATMDSLSSYDKGTVHSEGRRYCDDLASFLSALDKIHKPMDK